MVHPRDYQPPLTLWSHLWRLALMVAFSAIATFGTPRFEYQWNYARWWLAIDLAVGLLCYVAVWWRRSHPVAVATFTNLAGLISVSATGPSSLALVSLATRRRWREIVPQLVLAVVCTMIADWFINVPGTQPLSIFDVIAIVAVVGLMLAWGMYIGSRRELVASWQSRAELAESEQSAKVREAQIAERSRIAREMHDVLAHRISTVNMYAGALVYRDDLTPAEMRENAVIIRDTSQLAMAELREVLGVLREGPGDAAPERPQAGSAQLEALIEENRETGMRIDYTCTADLAGLPTSVGRTLYRCVQESLTNARKHASGAAVSVRLSGGAGDGVSLEVTNPLPLVRQPVPDSGFGLVGLAERVELAGGTQSHRVTGDQRFVLQVWLPWPV